ncbi:MAG: hypothetical protein CMM26_06685 [Rhodospirillaceae bacterium]|nr:hypothetical protein [Rhodospirillaceae bacterium]
MAELTLEDTYEALAESLDEVTEAQTPVYLAKVCLALAQELGDHGKTLEIIRACREYLDG